MRVRVRRGEGEEAGALMGRPSEEDAGREEGEAGRHCAAGPKEEGEERVRGGGGGPFPFSEGLLK